MENERSERGVELWRTVKVRKRDLPELLRRAGFDVQDPVTVLWYQPRRDARGELLNFEDEDIMFELQWQER